MVFQHFSNRQGPRLGPKLAKNAPRGAPFSGLVSGTPLGLHFGSKIDPKMRQNSWKIDLWSRLGALWALSWRQDGPRVAPRARIDEKSSISGWPVGSKMEPKSIRNQMKNWLDFCNDFESTFSRYWVDFGSKNEGSQEHFFDLVTNMWKVRFGTTLPSFCYIFRFWKLRSSTLKGVFLSCFCWKRF